MEHFWNTKINDYIDEFFSMEKGEVIINPQEMIPFGRNIIIYRRALKHIVEQRSLNDGFIVLVLDSINKEKKRIITIFRKEPSQFLKLL